MFSNIRRFVYVLCCVTLVFGVPSAKATTAGTTGGQLLELMPDARSGGMGEAFCGVADDANCLFYNPAGLGDINWIEIPLASNQIFGGVNHQFIGLAYSLRDFRSLNVDDLGTLAGGYSELSSGDIDNYTVLGTRTGTYNVKDKLITLAYGKAILDGEESGRLLAGASIKLLSENIAGYTADNTVYDAGVLWHLPSSGLSLGLTAQNMGSKLSYSQSSFDPPSLIKAGAGYKTLNDSLVLAFDVNNPNQGDLFYNLGGEYYLLKALAVRAGYNSRSSQSGISFGFGVNIEQLDFLFLMYARELTIDYAFIPMGDLGNTQRISLVLKLGAD
jgi:hypothetical protein